MHTHRRGLHKFCHLTESSDEVSMSFMLKLSLKVKEIQIMMDPMMTRGDGSQEAVGFLYEGFH